MNSIYSSNDTQSHKTRCAVTFMNYLSSEVSLTILSKTLIWNKITFQISNSLNLVELVVNKLTKSTSKQVTNTPFSMQFISTCCKDFKSLKNEITFRKSSAV